MKITINDIKRAALEKIGGASSHNPDLAPDQDISKLASRLENLGKTNSNDDTALIYLDMIKKAHQKARARLGLGERLSLR